MASETSGAPRLTMPTIPASDSRFKWTNGADVQATWRRFGWMPPSEKRTSFFEEPVREPAPRVRRVA